MWALSGKSGWIKEAESIRPSMAMQACSSQGEDTIA